MNSLVSTSDESECQQFLITCESRDVEGLQHSLSTLENDRRESGLARQPPLSVRILYLLAWVVQ